ncbi:hypothetical protein [Vibrio sp. 10N.261.46.A3]|uniref:hypothetical protein n=1 Tax=Vibrio sp. 10N.261.46.A3 TaxID=3229658 RepID=UPI0035520C4E
MKSEGQRYFKMQFPEESCPIITIKGRSRRVTVLSENAIVVLAKGGVSSSRMGAIVSGVVTYPNGVKDEVHGYIVFIKGKNVIVKLLQGVSMYRMNEQQVWVRQHYPDFDMRMK